MSPRCFLPAVLLCLLFIAACAPIGTYVPITHPAIGHEPTEVCPGYERALADPNLQKHYILSPPGDSRTARGVIGEPVLAESGERLELRWEGFSPVYHLYYYGPREKEGLLIGECPFSGGCNKAQYLFEDKNKNGIPDAFRLVEYESLDFVQDEKTPGFLDRYRHIYVVTDDRYCVIHDLLFYACPPPVSPELNPCETFCNPPYRTSEAHGRMVPLVYRTEVIRRGTLLNKDGKDNPSPLHRE